MTSSATTIGLIPPPVQRRLTLSLLGWRFSAGVWRRGTQTLTEEAVDTMSARAWQALIGRWAMPASAMN
jgi:hypothetical protein